MRQLSIALWATLFAVVVGCNDGSMTGPAGDPALLDEHPSKVAAGIAGQIPLDGFLKDPGFSTAGLTKISGLVKYSIAHVAVTEAASVSCKLTVDADLWRIEERNGAWGIFNSSEHTVALAGGSGSVLRHYTIAGRNDNVVLRMVFTVTAGSVAVESMVLEKGKVVPEPMQEL